MAVLTVENVSLQQGKQPDLLVGANTFTGLITAYLTSRQYFTPAMQLALPDTSGMAS